jgi:2-dehydropantoate 2-reductase
VAYIYSRLTEPGVIEHYKKGTVAIGSWGSSGELSSRGETVSYAATTERGTFAKLGELRRQTTSAPAAPQPPPGLSPSSIKSLFEGAGVACQLVEDVRRTKWEKMCWNVVFNPLTVLINDRVAKAISHPEMRAMIKLIVEEAVAVAQADGVSLSPDIAEKVIQWSQEIRDIHTSMFDDWKAGRRTEIDSLNGYIARRGRALGLSTPVNDAVCALIKTITEPAPMGPALLRIEGEVMQPLLFDADTLAKLPAGDQVPDVSVADSAMRGQGVRIRALLNVATGRIGADHVTFHSADGRFAVSLTLDEAAGTGLLIYARDGRPLTAEEGGPYRFIAPGLNDRCANVKGVARIEFTIGPGKDTRQAAAKA